MAKKFRNSRPRPYQVSMYPHPIGPLTLYPQFLREPIEDVTTGEYMANLHAIAFLAKSKSWNTARQYWAKGYDFLSLKREYQQYCHDQHIKRMLLAEEGP